MTPYREWFSKYKNYDGGEVLMEDNRPIIIIDHRRVKVFMCDGMKKSLKV